MVQRAGARGHAFTLCSKANPDLPASKRSHEIGQDISRYKIAAALQFFGMLASTLHQVDLQDVDPLSPCSYPPAISVEKQSVMTIMMLIMKLQQEEPSCNCTS